MTVKILIVDDSVFFRRALRELIATDERLSVIGEAANGREAILKACQLKPDVITMDVEMPVMDGISAVREIMGRCPAPILMLSSLTQTGAIATLDALDAGAVDFFPKSQGEQKDHLGASSARLLTTRLRMLALRRQRLAMAPAEPVRAPSGAAAPKSDILSRRGIVVIGSSTGGPAALQAILQGIPASFPLPIVIAQHMPASFTGPFANRLNESMPIQVVEAQQGIALQPGCAYIIPGGKHGEIHGRLGAYVFSERQPVAGENFRPSANILLQSAATVAGGDALGLILTGMGDDGTEGARALRAAGGTVWAQDQATSVIYGMPAAVAKAGLTQAILPLGEISGALMRCVR
ncbi:chemotaxis response regulator protein-glutamate methylesterase [Halothiobacillus sp. DCM-1]|uniref:protein-glutamate methylesterase/protein-glutamine glutaminase n=1 Tax=Halothiobacillus sp. DCM-1 TaxID=3112558 RepID=UPI00325174F7